MNPLTSSLRNPLPSDVVALNRDVHEFVSNIRRRQTFDYYGTHRNVFRFHLDFADSPNCAVLNHVELAEGWRRHGIFTALVRHLQALPAMEEITVLKARSAPIQHRLRKLGFEEAGDHNFFLAFGSSHRASLRHRVNVWARRHLATLTGSAPPWP